MAEISLAVYKMMSIDGGISRKAWEPDLFEWSVQISGGERARQK